MAKAILKGYMEVRVRSLWLRQKSGALHMEGYHQELTALSVNMGSQAGRSLQGLQEALESGKIHVHEYLSQLSTKLSGATTEALSNRSIVAPSIVTRMKKVGSFRRTGSFRRMRSLQIPNGTPGGSGGSGGPGGSGGASPLSLSPAGSKHASPSFAGRSLNAAVNALSAAASALRRSTSVEGTSSN